MKKHLLAIISCAAVVLCGCKTEVPVPIPNDQLVGLWGLTLAEQSSQNGVYEEYVRFMDDGNFEYYAITNPEYAYHRGTYTNVDGQLTMLYKKLRRFEMVEDVARYTVDVQTDDYWNKGELTIIGITGNSITLKTRSGKCYMYKATTIANWNEEYSAPEIPVTADALLGQWDQVNFSQTSGTGSTWWYFYEPDKMGISFAADAALDSCPFWQSRVLEKLRLDNIVMASELVEVKPADCSWSLNADTITLTCSQYVAYKADSEGHRSNERTVTPETPIALKYPVAILTDYYMIIFNAEANLHHSFHKQAKKSAGAPARCRNVTEEHSADPLFSDKFINSALFR